MHVFQTLRAAKRCLCALVVLTAASIVVMNAASWASASEYATKAARFNNSLDTSEDTFSRFIVTYQDPRAAAQSGRIALDLTHVSMMTGIDLKPVRWLATGGVLLYSPRKLERAQAQRLIQEFALIDEIEYAQPDYAYQLAANDPQIGAQWHLSPVVPNTTYLGANGWSVQAGANVIAGWSYSVGAGVVIGVLDGGYTYHPDLEPNLAPIIAYTNQVGFDFVYGIADVNDPVQGWDCDAHDPGSWYLPDPVHYPSVWHGTHVMGLAAAVYNNGLYGAGVAPMARLMPVRVAGESGLGYESDLVDAIIWASGSQQNFPPPYPGDPVPPSQWTCNGITHTGLPGDFTPARVINLSWASYHPCGQTSMQKAIDAARNSGSVVVVAAGNGNTNVSGVSPASCANTITVAATDFGGVRARTRDANGNNTPYTNYGTGVTLAAPGGGYGAYLDPPKPPTYFDVPVMSDWNTGATVPGGPSFHGIEGTSMSAPLVSGLAAAMVSIKPFLSPDDVRAKLIANVRHWGDDIPPASQIYPIGAGLMDAAATLSAVSALPNPASATMSATPNPVIVPAGQNGGFYTWSWTVPGYSVVDVYVSENNGPWVYNHVWPANFHPTTQNYVPVDYPITWKLTPHGDTVHVLASVTVTAHH